MDSLEALDRSRGEFERRLARIGPADWGRPTPCSEWDVRALANHVVGGCRRYTMLLHGATAGETDALRALDHLGADPTAAFTGAADEMTAAFREPDALTRTVHHPAGDRTGQVLLAMRIVDFTVHGWDLARALGVDEALDPELVELLWVVLSAMEAELAAGGYFALPPGPPDPGASRQDQLLRLTGRTP